MADSPYLMYIMFIILGFPVYLVMAIIFVEDEDIRKAQFKWIGGTTLIVFSVLVFLHMDQDIIYGKELLDRWFATRS